MKLPTCYRTLVYVTICNCFLLLIGCNKSDDPAYWVAQIEQINDPTLKGDTERTQAALKQAGQATEELTRIGEPAFPAMIEGLGNEEKMVRTLLAQTFIKAGNAAVPPLTIAVTDKDATRRLGAVESLYQLHVFGQIDVSAAVPALKAATKDADADVRQTALTTVRDILHEKAAEWLIPALKDPDVKVRRTAARTLGLGVAVDGQGLPKKGTSSLLPQQTQTLMKVTGLDRPVPAEAASALIEALDDEDQAVRSYAVAALGKIGPQAEAAIPRLIKLLEQQPEQSGDAIAQALPQMGPNAVGPLIGLTRSQNNYVRAQSVRALVILARTESAAFDAILAALKSDNPELRCRVAIGMSTLGPKAQAALPALREAEHDPSENVRRAATEAIKYIQQQGEKGGRMPNEQPQHNK